MVSVGDPVPPPCRAAMLYSDRVAGAFLVVLEPEGSITTERSEKRSWRLGLPAHWHLNFQSY